MAKIIETALGIALLVGYIAATIFGVHKVTGTELLVIYLIVRGTND